MMITIVNNNREVLLDPVGTRVVRVHDTNTNIPLNGLPQWSGWIVQQYNSASVAMGALGKELCALPASLRTRP